MTIPNVVLGELIDPVTFGNAVVDAVNEHETEIADRLPLSGGTVTGDLKVAGNSDLKINVPADFWRKESGIVFGAEGMVGGTQGAYATSMTSNGYRNASNKWTSMLRDGKVGATQIDLLPTGAFNVRASADHPTGSDHTPELRFSVNLGLTRAHGDLKADGNITTGAGKKVNFGGNWDGGRVYNSASAGREFLKIGESADGGAQVMLYGNGDRIGNDHSSTETPYPGGATIFTGGSLTALFHNNNNTKLYGDLQANGTITDENGPVRSFAIAEGIDTADVLDRAETATMPVLDDEGVATTDAEVESITVNEVVTALLAKVKELSARIEELEGN